MVEIPAGKSLKPIVITAVLTLDELGAVVRALLSYYQTTVSYCPDEAWALIQRLTQMHGQAVQEHAEAVLFEMRQ